MRVRELLCLVFVVQWVATTSFGANGVSSLDIEHCLKKGGETATEIEKLLTELQLSIKQNSFRHRNYISPSEMRALDKKTIAEMIVARLNKECELPRAPKEKSELVDMDLVMMVPSKNLLSIARYGFQNQHMTQTTGGLDGRNFRFMQEQGLATLRLPYNNKGRELLPKYAVMNIRRNDAGKLPAPTHYGDAMIVFKKEVSNRTTWTKEDSLNINFEKNNGDFPPRTTRYRKGTNEKWNCDTYCEGQIWGPIDLRDVDHILVPKGKEISAEMKNLGIPVFELLDKPAPENASGSLNYMRGKQLTKGDPELVPAPETMSRAEIELALTKTEIPAVKSILESRLLETLGEGELIEFLEKALVIPPPEIGVKVTPRRREDVKALIGELASRPLTEKVANTLLANSDHHSPDVRAQVLLGLSEMPFPKFRPLLAKALKDGTEETLLMALAIASEHPGDQELQALAAESAMTEPVNGYRIAEFARRFRQQKFCGKE